jgi:hypothetical protein
LFLMPKAPSSKSMKDASVVVGLVVPSQRAMKR